VAGRLSISGVAPPPPALLLPLPRQRPVAPHPIPLLPRLLPGPAGRRLVAAGLLRLPRGARVRRNHARVARRPPQRLPDPLAATSIGILHSVRRLRPEVPVLVRTEDDARIKELQDAGATDVVPETFEASLMLVSHVLMLLRVPVPRVVRPLGDIRSNRYAVLRNIVRRGDARPVDETSEHREELKSVVVPPGAWAVGRTLAEVRN